MCIWNYNCCLLLYFDQCILLKMYLCQNHIYLITPIYLVILKTSKIFQLHFLAKLLFLYYILQELLYICSVSEMNIYKWQRKNVFNGSSFSLLNIFKIFQIIKNVCCLNDTCTVWYLPFLTVKFVIFDSDRNVEEWKRFINLA